MTLLVPPALLAVVVAVAVLGGQGEVVPDQTAAPAARVTVVASAVAAPSQALTATIDARGKLGPMLIPYEWRARLADRVDRFTIDDTVLLAAPRRVDRFTIDDSVYAMAAPPQRRSDWPRAIASSSPR